MTKYEEVKPMLLQELYGKLKNVRTLKNGLPNKEAMRTAISLLSTDKEGKYPYMNITDVSIRKVNGQTMITIIPECEITQYTPPVKFGKIKIFVLKTFFPETLKILQIETMKK